MSVGHTFGLQAGQSKQGFLSKWVSFLWCQYIDTHTYLDWELITFILINKQKSACVTSKSFRAEVSNIWPMGQNQPAWGINPARFFFFFLLYLSCGLNHVLNSRPGAKCGHFVWYLTKSMQQSFLTWYLLYYYYTGVNDFCSFNK